MNNIGSGPIEGEALWYTTESLKAIIEDWLKAQNKRESVKAHKEKLALRASTSVRRIDSILRGEFERVSLHYTDKIVSAIGRPDFFSTHLIPYTKVVKPPKNTKCQNPEHRFVKRTDGSWECRTCKFIRDKARSQRIAEEMRIDSNHNFHGTRRGYKAGCKCGRCAVAEREARRRWLDKKRTELAA